MYKGYYYDEETKLYYCISRYNSPEFRKFISHDKCNYLEAEELNGLNLYCYCGNDPINYADSSGHLSISFLIGLGISVGIGAIVGATMYTLSEVVSYAITGEWSWSWAQFAGNVLGGALGGALAFITPAASSVLIGGLTGFSSTGFSMIFQNQFEESNYSIGQIIGTSLLNGIIAAGATWLFNAIKIPGLNSSRNSYLAISKQIVTKFRNGTISKITYNTFSKILTYNLTQNLIGSLVSGSMDASNVNDKYASWLGGFLLW